MVSRLVRLGRVLFLCMHIEISALYVLTGHLNAAREISCSLALQKIIFFNSWFSLAWWITTTCILCRKYMTGLVMVDPDEVRTIFMVLFMVFEPIRLTAGYYGNLREEVPLLLVMILLSIIPTLPACMYMFVAQYHMDSYQLALQWPQLAFLLASIGFGSYALSKVHKLNQRQQAIMKSSQTEMHQWKWATKSLISMETPPGQLHAREMDNMSSSHRNGEGDGDFSGVGTGAHRATGMWHGTDRARA